MNKHPIAKFFRVASVLMLLVVVAMISAIITIRLVIHGAEVQVPALKGMTVAQARSETAGLGLNLEVDNRYYSGGVAAGHILSQSPDPGTVVRRGWHVRIAESLGPQQVDVPNTVGMPERVADLTLRRAGIEVAQPAYLPTNAVLEGTVLAQDPPAHAQDIAQPSVSLLVAAPDNEQPAGYVMPYLTGTQAAADLALFARVGIHVAPFRYVNVAIPVVSGRDRPVPPDSVLTQYPLAGSRIDPSTIVQLTVVR